LEEMEARQQEKLKIDLEKISINDIDEQS